MSASGQSPTPRRANTGASAPSIFHRSAKPRRAADPVQQTASALSRATKATVGLATGAALIGGMMAATAQPAAASALDHAPRLHKGERGTAVVRLQRELSAYGKNVPDTGYFGSITKSRVNTLKARHGWRTDGVAGRRVWRVLLSDGHRVSSPSLVHHSSGGSSSGSSSSSSTKGLKALRYAKAQLGDPYVYGANGPGSFDCSGLTQAAWRAAGVSLPHNTNAQYSAARHISKSQLRKGDLVFFYSGRSHVAIYAGNGRVIHSPRPGEGVQYIKMSYMPYNGAARPA